MFFGEILQVTLENNIGSGHFADIYKAKVTYENGVQKLAAAKRLKNFGTSVDQKKRLVEEVNIMRSCNHKNVIQIINFVNDDTILMPLLKGDLRTEMRKLKATKQQFAPHKLQEFCYEISLGMQYLSSRGIVHRDLAARNCLLDENNHVKISDFGLAHKLKLNYESQADNIYYRSQSGVPLPGRWMALESLASQKFSEKTDVWSYGVVMWEIYSGGDMPYYNVRINSLADMLNYLQNGNRLQAPPEMPPARQATMKECWDNNPSQRPTFDDIAHSMSPPGFLSQISSAIWSTCSVM